MPKYVHLFVSSININWCIPFALQLSIFGACSWKFSALPIKKIRGVLHPPLKIPKCEPLQNLSFRLENLNWPSFNEIGEMTCIVPCLVICWIDTLKVLDLLSYLDDSGRTKEFCRSPTGKGRRVGV